MTSNPTPEQNAATVASALQARGYHVTSKHYGNTDDLERWFVTVTVEGAEYSTQFHDEAQHGYSFKSHRGPGFVPAIAQVLDGIMDEALL